MAADFAQHTIGVWQRELLKLDAGTEDTTTLVFWLQSRSVHGDIRVPAKRRMPSSASSLADYDRASLLRLAAQEGFAGRTTFSDCLARWQRLIDYHPLPDTIDEGALFFETDDELTELGVHSPYRERWRRLSKPGCPYAAYGDSDGVDESQCLLVLVDNWFIYARARDFTLPSNQTFSAYAATLSDAKLRAALDCEISFGRIENDTQAWRIQHSTLPFLQGRSLQPQRWQQLENSGSADHYSAQLALISDNS